jgi:hypothetical protein
MTQSLYVHMNKGNKKKFSMYVPTPMGNHMVWQRTRRGFTGTIGTHKQGPANGKQSYFPSTAQSTVPFREAIPTLEVGTNQEFSLRNLPTPVSREVEIGRIVVQGQPRQTVQETPPQLNQ